MSNVFLRTVCLALFVVAYTVTDWCAHNIPGLFDHHTVVAACSGATLLYLGVRFEEELPPTSKWARNFLVVVALAGLLLNPRVQAATLVVLFIIWAAVIAFNYDLVVIWWRRLRRNRQVRKERKRLLKQARKHTDAGVGIFEVVPDPEPAA